jgi:transposase InsO family protein
MPFGLTNAPATFQRSMNHTFRDILFKFALCYLDDLIVYSKTFEDHIRHLDTVFQLIRKANLRLQMKKCQFARTILEFLGHIVSREGVSLDPKKILAINAFPAPTNVKELQSFLGLANYYRKFVRAFAEKAHPLTQLTRKDVKWKWEDDEQRAFDSIKHSLTTHPVLCYPDFSKDFIVHTDASNFGVGAVLCQMQDPSHSGSDHEVVIAYSSKHLIDRELKWSTTEKEGYAIIHAVTVFRPYLYGRRFKVITDHRALEWLMSKKEPAGRLARWSLKLQEYQIEIGYRSGKTHQNADCLSRTPVHLIGAVFSGYNDWIDAQKRDEYCSKVKTGDLDSKAKFIILSNGLIATKGGHVVVPLSLKQEILKLNHDHTLAGHLGVNKTLARIPERYYWPNMTNGVTAHVNSCLVCAKQKVKGSSKAPLQSMPLSDRVWETIAMDIVGPVTESTHGFKYILVISDYATRYVIACPMENITAKTVASHFIKEVLLKFGAPERVLTDQGRQFTSNLYAKVCNQFNITKLRTTSYHPQCDGLVERWNRSMKDMLTSYVSNNPEEWDDFLPYVVLAYNVSIHTSTKYSPFFLQFGRDPLLATDLMPASRSRYVMDDDDTACFRWAHALEFAKDHLLKSQKMQKRNYDKGSSVITYALQDRVLLRSPPLPGKFIPKWEGPFIITRILSPL